MKDFFEDLGKRLSETAEAVTAKAGDAIEIQKLKAQIRELARGNAEDLMELGQSIYDRFENGEELDEASKGLCEAIASRKESIEEYENKIEGLKGACECTRCGKMVAKDMAFCPYCGSPVVEEEDIFEADDLAQEVREEAEEAEESVTEAAEAAVQTLPLTDTTPCCTNSLANPPVSHRPANFRRASSLINGVWMVTVRCSFSMVLLPFLVIQLCLQIFHRLFKTCGKWDLF